MTSGQIIKNLRIAANMTQEELAKKTGYTDRSSIAKIESGKCELTESKVKLFAEALKTTPSVILNLEKPKVDEEDQVTIDLIGDVAAGYNHFAVYETDAGKINIPLSWLKRRKASDFFALRVSGNSMYPLYQENDIVIILRQNTIDYSGQICVVRYNDDMATLKRVEYNPKNNCMKLVPVNPNYEPITITGEKLDHCDVLGIPQFLIRFL